jgi:methionyl-tRNA formyltransferase
MRIIFMGTPEFAVPTLTEIVSTGHEVVAVYTRAPKPAGRGQAERKSPVHEAAEGFGIPVFTPRSLRQSPEQEVFASLDADVAVVVAYGLILPKPILDAPRLGCLNLHGSLLPRWRGAAPIQRAVMAGDARTGIMVMQMDEGLDTGAVGLVEEMPIGPDMTSGEVHDKMMLIGADLMGRALAALDRGSLRRQDRQGRSPDRLDQACGRGAQPHPRAVAVPGRLVRADAQRHPHAHQGAALDARQR